MRWAIAAIHAGGSLTAWRATLSGLCASLVGIGLARFAYSPLIPALIAEGWFTPAEAVYLGAANLAGYLAGALLARKMVAHIPATMTLRSAMLLAAMAFFACAWPLSFAWFFVWRFGAGVAGGVLMVLAAPAVLPHVPSSRRGLTGGIIFTGVGLGVIASGTLVPFLLRDGLMVTWLGLGALALALTIVAWSGWPKESAGTAAVLTSAPRERPQSRRTLRAFYLEYGLNAFGLVPHMVFLVDFVARGLARGIDIGAQYWIFFGIGAISGPVLAGVLADRVGFGPALRICLLIQAAAVGLPAITESARWLIVSSVVVGALVPGMVPLALGRVHELASRDGLDQQAAWSVCAAAFAVGQAIAAYGFSFLFDRTGSYIVLFGLAAAVTVLALTIDIAMVAFARFHRDSCGGKT